MNHSFHDLIANGKPAFGMYVGDCGAAVCEMALLAGFDFLRIDNEHAMNSPSELRMLIRMADAFAVPSIVRVTSAEEATKVLDYGADAVLIPDVETGEQAAEAVKCSKYAPLGSRGMTSFARCQNYGLTPLTQYHGEANRRICTAIQIESVYALDHLDEILSVEGLDIVATGPLDLSQSMGTPAQTGTKEMQEAEELVIRKTLERGLYPLITASSLQKSARLSEQGVVLQTICYDSAFISAKLRDLVGSYRNGV